MSYLRESLNEEGKPISVFKCNSCNEVFDVCPAIPEEVRVLWSNGGCQSEKCSSYGPKRDCDILFGEPTKNKKIIHIDMIRRKRDKDSVIREQINN